jgi:hypothetical protein
MDGMQIETFDPDMLTREKWVGFVDLTPDGAKTLIGMNTRNRKIKGGKITQYVDAIVDGRWQMTPDAIAVESGVLVNGQHRCRAIIQADRPVPVVLMVNGGTAFDVIDNGASRTASDVLFLAGLTDNPGQLARASKLYLDECGVPGTQLADNRFVERWVLDHADLDTWVSWAIERRDATRTEAASTLAVPIAVLGYAIEDLESQLRDGGEDTHRRILSGYPNLAMGRTGRTDQRPADRIPTIENARGYLHRLIARTGVEDGSVEQLIVNDLDRWLGRSATDRRMARPTAPDTLRLVTWGLDQVTRGLTPKRIPGSVLTAPWLWARSAPGQQALFS